jgi:hypothetical protein
LGDDTVQLVVGAPAPEVDLLGRGRAVLRRIGRAMPASGDGSSTAAAALTVDGRPDDSHDGASRERFFAWGRAGYRWVVVTAPPEVDRETVREFATDLEEAAGVASDLLGLEARVRGVARALGVWAEVATRADHVAYAWDVVVMLHPQRQEA